MFEAGNSSYVEWKLSSSSSSLPIASRYESNPPLVQESFVRDLPLYHFDAAEYVGTPIEVCLDEVHYLFRNIVVFDGIIQILIVAPGASLSYVHSDLSGNRTLCYHTAFIAGALKWTAEVAQAFTQQFNSVVVSDCKVRRRPVLPGLVLCITPLATQFYWFSELF